MGFKLAGVPDFSGTYETPAFTGFEDINDYSPSFSISLFNGDQIIGQARGKEICVGLLDLQWIGVHDGIKGKRTGLADYLVKLALSGSKKHLGTEQAVFRAINPRIPIVFDRLLGDAVTYFVDHREHGRVSVPLSPQQAALSIERVEAACRGAGEYASRVDRGVRGEIDLNQVDMTGWEVPELEMYAPREDELI